MENTVFELMLNVSLGNMVCRLHQIDGMFVYGAYFEVLVGWYMFTFVSKRIISWIVVVLFTLCVEIVEYGGADKSLARLTSRCILFDGENVSFDASLVIYEYINSTNITPINNYK